MAARQVVANNDVIQEVEDGSILPQKKKLPYNNDVSILVWIGKLWANGRTGAYLYFVKHAGTDKENKKINPQQLWPRIMNNMTHNDMSLLKDALRWVEDGPSFKETNFSFSRSEWFTRRTNQRQELKRIVKAALEAKITELEPIRKQWEEQRAILLDGIFQAQIPEENSQAQIPKVISKTLASFSKDGGRKSRKSNKAVRKHRGIVQTGGKAGKLKKGYKYSGKKLKNGKPEIVKVNKN